MTINDLNQAIDNESSKTKELVAHRECDDVPANDHHDLNPTASADLKPILVLVNPHSGQGRSVKIFKKYVLRLLEEHDVKYDLFVTTIDLRVRQYLLSKRLEELTKYRAIMVVAGDGLLYETVNALMARPDWQEVMHIPVGAVPTGSGNGLAYTLLNNSHIPFKSQTEAIKICCEQIIRPQKRPCDLVRLRYGNETVWSFLSIGWGLLADIDIDSEWLRCLGEFRFTVYGLLRSLTSVSYKGRLSFKLPPVDENDEFAQKLNERLRSDPYVTQFDESLNSAHKRDDDSSSGSDWVHIEDKFVCLYAVHQNYVNRGTNFSPRSSFTDELTYLTYIRGTLNIFQAIEFLLAIEDGLHDKLPYVRVVPVQSFEFQPLQSSKVVVDGEVISWTTSDGPISVTVVPKAMQLAWAESC